MKDEIFRVRGAMNLINRELLSSIKGAHGRYVADLDPERELREKEEREKRKLRKRKKKMLKRMKV